MNPPIDQIDTPAADGTESADGDMSDPRNGASPFANGTPDAANGMGGDPLQEFADDLITGRRKRDEVASATSPDGGASERVLQVLQAVGEVVYEWTLSDDTITWGDNVVEVLQVFDSKVISTGRGYATLLDPENMTSRFDAVMNSPQVDEGNGVPFQVEYRLLPRGRDGGLSSWVEDTGRWFAGSGGRPVKVYGVIRKVDERHEREQRLAYLSNYDPLTGNMNRSKLVLALGETLNQASRYNLPCAFVLAGIDNLATVNDAYGFDIADQVIAAVSKRLKEQLRTGDYIGRYAGNKFGLVLNNCSDRDMEVAAKRFRDAVRESVIETSAGPVSATTSLGGVVMPNHAENVADAMVRAEEALSQAKARHRDTFVAYERSVTRDNTRKRNIAIADEIVSALNERRLGLAYQPIINAKTGTPAHYECLLRMMQRDGEIISAGHMIPVAEQLGLVRLVDHRVLELCIEALEEAPDVRLTVNVSGITTANPAWFAHLQAFLASAPAVADRLTVEITETAAIGDIEESTKFVRSLRDLGCRVAIDDFGAGYTSFRNLKLLEVDMIKIDGSFVKDLHEDADNQFFVRTLIDLAKNFNLVTVAEWVMDKRDADLLLGWGIDYLQGHLFGEASLTKPWQGQEPVQHDLSAIA